MGSREGPTSSPHPQASSQYLLFSPPKNSKSTQVRMAVSKIRQNYHEDCEASINKQINMEFYASYVYLSMSSFFNRDDQALHGFAEHFKKESGEERAHGIKAIGDLIVKMKRAGDGLGLYLIDKEM